MSTSIEPAAGAVPDRERGIALSWLRIRAVARRHAYVLARSPHRLFDVTLWPLVDALLFGALAAYVGGGDVTGGGQAAGYLIAGIVLWHVVYQSQISVSTGLLEETWSRNLLNLMVTPMREVEYVGGVALFGMFKLALGVGVVALGALVFYSFNVSTLGFGLIPIAAILLLVGWTIALFVIGIVLRFGSGAEALAWGVMFVVMPLSGIFYPVESLPTVLQPVAQALPTTHAFAALRGLVDGGALEWDQLAIALAETVVFAVLAFWFLVRMLRTFRRRGYITRFT
jgi:ABC-2 type transport system permease protein